MRVTAEMRWFWPGQCPSDLETWFFKPSPRAGGGQPRSDEYVRPSNGSELGIKKRGITNLQTLLSYSRDEFPWKTIRELP